MIHTNLQQLRRDHHLTQEQLAEKLGVSRQVISKWESGESTPDLSTCEKLAALYGVTVDTLIHYSDESTGLKIPPKGKYFFGNVTVGERGQIVIPKKARTLFHISPGDSLILVGDEDRGLALIPQSYMKLFFDSFAFREGDTQ